jgi:hypothetical protein
MNGAVAHHTRNVQCCRDGRMLLRWIGAARYEAHRGFRRVRGHRDLAKRCAVLERHCNAQVPPAERKVA